MNLAIITLMVELLSEISAIDTPGVAVIQSRQGPASPTTPLIAVIGASGAVGAAITAAIAAIYGARYKGRTDKEIERLRTIHSLQVEYDQDLRKRRIDSYIKLWSSTMSLARYPEPGPLPYKRVGPLATYLRDWYFTGGLFMSEQTRNVYFNFQDALRIVAQKREGRWPFAVIDMENPEDVARLKHHLRPNEDWEIPDEVAELVNDTQINQSGENVPDGAFNNLRLLGSKVRTELAYDVRTREVSELNIREQKNRKR